LRTGRVTHSHSVNEPIGDLPRRRNLEPLPEERSQDFSCSRSTSGAHEVRLHRARRYLSKPRMMKLLVTSWASVTQAFTVLWSILLGKLIAESNALHSYRDLSLFPQCWYGIPGDLRKGPSPCANWAGSRWECWNSPRCRASLIRWPSVADLLARLEEEE
jgi:hypothetical protein